MKTIYTTTQVNPKAITWFKVMGLSMLFAGLLFGSGCKKENVNDGIPSGPSNTGFPGCQLTNYGDFLVSYNANGTIHSYGSNTYTYSGNNLRIDIAPNEYFTFVLDSKKNPISSVYVNDIDSNLVRYTYTNDGYLSKLEVIEMVDGKAGATMELTHEYKDGNRTKSILSSNLELFSTITYHYDLNIFDARKDFYERVFYNDDDPLTTIPVFAGKGNKNMLLSVDYNEGGSSTFTRTCTYTYDSDGKVLTEKIKEAGYDYASIFYSYLCK